MIFNKVGFSKGFNDRVVFGHFAVSIPCPNLSDKAIPEYIAHNLTV